MYGAHYWNLLTIFFLEMAKEMHVPCTEHSYEDNFFVHHMHKRHKDVGSAFVVKDMMKAFNLKYDEIKEMLDKFASATEARVMNFAEFCRALNLKDDTAEAQR